ncbi:hypothetical protein Mp_7g17550 [Marchantia polymorpha subsp. ruderalis]|uniref:Uncharacterized protein n=2 Tax=Marchantia polymorpha TaxID=3197 RepID=A0AAF6C0T4_MARPO|nr:hypothetical protein MARPO_0051s0093 [Marchantia polymorpha]PTQ38494.1 hypothetical protein MARPO_0051s0093 [Marchantia polymorpha]BBN17867.1 hypothetical protein Mp_7g17550 [Marchantia polymorpha subsp. ruderalis]BBN17868.1 hypothetical protein Mp_7g17550 [Marchantia polymorpha subsp. ruderalis]|eukprot:PTQ38493.1 hypothetical protein MARPO_0051s0093 [Marchantia polymorpha]
MWRWQISYGQSEEALAGSPTDREVQKMLGSGKKSKCCYCCWNAIALQQKSGITNESTQFRHRAGSWSRDSITKVPKVGTGHRAPGTVSGPVVRDEGRLLRNRSRTTNGPRELGRHARSASYITATPSRSSPNVTEGWYPSPVTGSQWEPAGLQGRSPVADPAQQVVRVPTAPLSRRGRATSHLRRRAVSTSSSELDDWISPTFKPTNSCLIPSRKCPPVTLPPRLSAPDRTPEQLRSGVAWSRCTPFQLKLAFRTPPRPCRFFHRSRHDFFIICCYTVRAATKREQNPVSDIGIGVFLPCDRETGRSVQ